MGRSTRRSGRITFEGRSTRGNGRITFEGRFTLRVALLVGQVALLTG